MWNERNACRIFGEKSVRKRQLERPRRRWVDYFKYILGKKAVNFEMYRN
jgi:hypothetical protein